MAHYKEKYRIPSARASWHEYEGGLYFVTLCTEAHAHYLGEIEEDIMQLSAVGGYAVECIKQLPQHCPYAEIPLFVIMPNHIHLLVEIVGERVPYSRRTNTQSSAIEEGHAPPSGSLGVSSHEMRYVSSQQRDIANMQGWLSVAVGSFKSAVTKYANSHHIVFRWQSRYHDHIIRNQAELNQIATYIENNVLSWGNDCYHK